MPKSAQLLITPSQITNTKARKYNYKQVKSWNSSLYNIIFMDPPMDQLQAPDGEEDQPEEAEELAQHTFYNSYYNHHYEEPQDLVTAKSLDNSNVANAISTGESHKNIHSERGVQESSRITKAKRRKSEKFEVHSGRIIRSTSRKDRHSKVCTTRGPKDRRVRLSPTTAIQFYDVQDRLGYDRPSKAIDWLMKEAKTAIEALNDSQAFASYKHLTAANAAKNHSQIQHGSASGMIQKHEDSDNADNPISSFGVFVNGDAPLPITDDFNSSRLYQEQGFLSALATTSQILDANLEMAKLQRIFTWNYDDTNAGDSTTLQYPLPPGLSHGQMFSQREPLQSSFINYSPISNDSPRLNFYSEEFSNFTATDSLEESKKDTIPISSKNSSAYFLHSED